MLQNPLKHGDRVAVVAPSSQFRSEERPLLQGAEQLLSSWGYEVHVAVSPDHHFYLAGTDEIRQRYLNESLTDPLVKAVFCTRGGYGSSRLMANLPDAQAIGSKMLVGHSDITSLHLALQSMKTTVQCIHGPNIATNLLLADTDDAGQNRVHLKALLAGWLPQPFELETVRTGRASAPILGGCMSMVACSIGTRFIPKFSGAILFLEDVGEAPYKIDRMLQQMLLAGVFEGVAGLVFGVMQDCSDPYNDLKSVILDVMRYTKFPIALGLPSGHGPSNTAFPLERQVVLECCDGGSSLKFL